MKILVGCLPMRDSPLLLANASFSFAVAQRAILIHHSLANGIL
jgi:hypothetical protein